MTIQESINRGFNLLGTSIMAITGFAFLPEAILEKDVSDKADDILLFVFAVAALYWYNRSTNKYVRSIMPVAFIVLAFLVKLTGVIIERNDPNALGDDVGGHILFFIAMGLMIYQYIQTGKLIKAAGELQ